MLAFYDAQGKHRAALSILGDEPKLILYDEQGQDRASVGVDVTTTKTGVETTYPESSIRLYGPDGFTLWSVP